MTRQSIKIEEIRRIGDGLRQLMKDMAETEGPLDVDSEFRSLITAKSESDGIAIDKLREMSRRFGPKFAGLLGIPPVAGAGTPTVVQLGISPPDIAALTKLKRRRTDGALLVRGRVHPGVKIHIGGASCRIDQPMSSVKFKYDPERHRIVTTPYL